MKRVVFDLATELFSEDFQLATDGPTRAKLAPKLRLACLFDVSTKTYHYFTTRSASSLIRLLAKADEVISYNGKQFDVLVLRRHHGLKGRVPRKGTHTDLCEILSNQAGFHVSLHRAAQLNLGESKYAHGHKEPSFNFRKLKTSCRSDVSQTYRLWRLHTQGKVEVPLKYEKETDEEFGRVVDESGGLMPSRCPHCKTKNISFDDWDTSSMSDAQASDYQSGFYGSGYCTSCGGVFDWGFRSSAS